MSKRKKYWSLLVKPTHDCNLNCKYCYDEPMRRKYKGCRMDFEMIDHILKLATDYAEEVGWIWHGGEPLLMGTKWYAEVQELFYKYSCKSTITQSLQSNGILLNRDWANINKKYNIDVGVSYDALSQEIRFESKESNVKENIQLYNNCGGNCGAITVVNKSNYKRLIEIYNHYKNELKISFSFNEVFVTEKSTSNDLNLSNEEISKEFKKFFEYWIYDTDKPIAERTALTFFDLLTGKKNNLCSYSDCRYNWISVNPAGIIYPCDRYVPEFYEMGNIMDYSSIEEIYDSIGHKKYSFDTECRFEYHCSKCGYWEYCKGGCNANHIAVAGDSSGIDENYCESFRKKLNIMYNLLREVDIYSVLLNNYLLKSILSKPIFTVKEIFDVLKKELDFFDLKNDCIKDDLLNSKEFRIFKLFNKHNDNELSREEIYLPKYSIDIKIEDVEDIKSIKSHRDSVIKDIINNNLIEIQDILLE